MRWLTNLLLITCFTVSTTEGQSINVNTYVAPVVPACYQTPTTCQSSNLQNPCAAAPNCLSAPSALCYVNYCSGQPCIGTIEYFYQNPVYVSGARREPCAGYGTGNYANNPYGYPSGVYPNTGGYANGGAVYPGYPAAQQSCSDLITAILGPSSGGAVVVGKREAPDWMAPSAQANRFRRQAGTVSSTTTAPNPELEKLVCNSTGCWVEATDAYTGETVTDGTLRLRGWHQTHKLTFLRQCDISVYSTQCQYGQQCCQIYQVFNKYYCVGKPVNPAQYNTNTQNGAQIPYVVGSAPKLVTLDLILSLTAAAIFFHLR